MKTIMVGYDGTEPAKRALERAAEIAEAFDAALIVTSVARLFEGASPSRASAYHAEQLREARAFLDERGRQAEYLNMLGDPAASIVKAAEEHAADLVVVGSREPRFAERLLRQSVSQTVSRKAHRDVLIVHREHR
jgi:nucleotide-binding universal stress UspA family protein